MSIVTACLLASLWLPVDNDPNPGSEALTSVLEAAGENRPELERALREVPDDQREGMEFLIANMPTHDLKTLGAEFLLKDVALAYEAWRSAAWRAEVSKEIFLDGILPYAVVDEERVAWRQNLRNRFLDLVADQKTVKQAATKLNREIWGLVNVKYSTGRKRPNQNALETIESGIASCSGLSILLIDACRAVGIPARFAGTPRWSDDSGNHSWVEVWCDGGWHFTGAAEPTGEELDQGWFVGRAATAKRDDPRYAIYATSWRATPIHFPLVWADRNTSVFGIDVTERYLGLAQKPNAGEARVRFKVTIDHDRCCVPIDVLDADDQVVFSGTTKDERFDANDHVTAILPIGAQVKLRVGGAVVREFGIERDEQLVAVAIADMPPGPVKRADGPTVLLEEFLGKHPLSEVASQPFAEFPLSASDAARAREILVKKHAEMIRKERAQEIADRKLVLGDLSMPFWMKTFGDAPKNGRSLWISMHGGGSAPKEVNDQQYENQKKLYQLEEGIYLVPRAPTDTWNMWHQGHIDEFYSRLIEDLVVLENVDPDRVYIMGYSAGGDGVYQLAPRFADRLAGAAMMAGHPNETRPDGLRNLAFALHVGGEDKAFDRNKIGAQWKETLDALRQQDPGGYEHQVEVHAGRGHWMNLEDKVALPWLAKFTRNRNPERIVWLQDDTTHSRFYWLMNESPKGGERIVAQRMGEAFTILEAPAGAKLRLRLGDEFVDLEREITVTMNGKELAKQRAPRTIATLAKTLLERGDPRGLYSAEIAITIPSP